jgi:hypothetical protein
MINLGDGRRKYNTLKYTTRGRYFITGIIIARQEERIIIGRNAFIESIVTFFWEKEEGTDSVKVDVNILIIFPFWKSIHNSHNILGFESIVSKQSGMFFYLLMIFILL